MSPSTYYVGLGIILIPILMVAVRATIDCLRHKKSTGMQVPLLAYVSLHAFT